MVGTNPTRVAVLEDNSVINEMLSILLRSEGLKVLSRRNNFGETLEPGYFDNIDVVIVDLNLAENISGEEILRHLISAYPNIKRILFSADDKARDYTDLADEVILKPASIYELLKAIGN